MTNMSTLFSKSKAPELRATRWFNSPPLTMAQLRGKVVLVDFMAYSCVNCVRTFPHMRYLWNKLKDHGLMIIGVQTPEFQFEKDFRNIEDAIARHGLEYPIAVDNDHQIWNAYGNQFWPAQYFIDKDGNIRHKRAGEGGEAEIEEWLARLLRDAGYEINSETGAHEEYVRLLDPITRETYCGFLRNTGMGNPAECDATGKCAYRDTDRTHQVGVIYLEGGWKQTEEFLEHDDDQRGHILLPYQAREVNLVMTSDVPQDIELLLDNNPIEARLAGADVRNEGPRTVARIDRQDMFRLIAGKDVESHGLKIVSHKVGLRAYAYTFG